MAPLKARVGRKSAAIRSTPSTRDRILEASIDLFNRHGVQHVAVEHIAAHMSISPGNLTYHFRRKRDLIRATFDLLQARMRGVLRPKLPAPTPEEGGEDLVVILRTFWELRFFFNALTFLLSQDRLLCERYFEFQDWALRGIEQGVKDMVSGGGFRPIRHPNNSRLLAENMWGHWLNWLWMQQLASPAAVMPEGHALYDSALHLWSLLEPYLKPEFADELLPVYRSLLLNDAAATRAGRSSGVSAGIPGAASPEPAKRPRARNGE